MKAFAYCKVSHTLVAASRAPFFSLLPTEILWLLLLPVLALNPLSFSIFDLSIWSHKSAYLPRFQLERWKVTVKRVVEIRKHVECIKNWCGLMLVVAVLQIELTIERPHRLEILVCRWRFCVVQTYGHRLFERLQNYFLRAFYFLSILGIIVIESFRNS